MATEIWLRRGGIGRCSQEIMLNWQRLIVTRYR
jgi:hypothetical protein